MKTACGEMAVIGEIVLTPIQLGCRSPFSKKRIRRAREF